MAINIPHGTSDETVDQIVAALRKYEADHQRSQIDVYRHTPVSVRMRVIDPDFAGHGKAERSQQFWRYLDQLPDDVQSDISMVVLLTPDETNASFGNFVFNDPVPSQL